MSFGENLKKLREEKGLTQGEVAKRLFVTVAMVSAIENGLRQPSLNLALALAKFFDTSVEAMCGYEG